MKSQREGEGREWSALEVAAMKTGKRIGAILQPVGFSSRRRMKVLGRDCCYHVMSRTVNGENLFGATEKEAFRTMMRRMEKFSGVEIFTYAVMNNHFHILLKVPDREEWLKRFEGDGGEERLLGHLGSIYSAAFLTQLRNELKSLRERGIEEGAERLLQKFKDRFCDVSLFVKELKERFSRWFNQQHGRKGTLWMDRYKSVLVDGEAALSRMAAYIDLNPVRAGLVEDPLEYEWSGFGEAMKGDGSVNGRMSRIGICRALGLSVEAWEGKVLARYQAFLYEEVAVERGEISVAEMLRRRVATMSAGVAIGQEEFVRQVAREYEAALKRTRKREPKKIGSTENPGTEVFSMRG